jgi:hypothetical protein
MTIEELQALVAKFQTLDRSDPEWMKAFEILDKECPGLIKMKVNQEWLQKHIAEMKARGEMVLPDSIPGLRLTRKVGGQSVDQN